MIRKFVDRSSELNFPEDSYKKDGLQVVVIYGRRRVGKTELIKRFIEDKDNTIYFLADQRGTEKNLERFTRAVQTWFSLPPLKIESFEDVFKIIAGRSPKMVVVIDEFSYLIEEDPALASVFQLIIDEVLKETNAFLILCGSSISIMEKGVLSYKSPLYGRRTGQIKLKPVEFRDLSEFFPDYSIEQLIEAYAVLGGVPAYLSLFDHRIISLKTSGAHFS
jgi:Predicted ATPase (AAA+ superfamily)